MGRKVVIESMSLGSSRRRRKVVEFSDEDEKFFAGVREVLQEIPESEDITIITLKAHLVIEQLLIQMMKVAAIDPEPIAELTRLQFSSRVLLVQSLMPKSVVDSARHERIWALVKKLGKIRNDIAHQLRPKNLETEILGFIELAIRQFGPRIVPPVHPVNRPNVTHDNYYIPIELRRGSLAMKYRNAVASTARYLAGTLGATRAYFVIAKGAIEKERAKRLKRSQRTMGAAKSK
jgi:hypothetical protein